PAGRSSRPRARRMHRSARSGRGPRAARRSRAQPLTAMTPHGYNPLMETRDRGKPPAPSRRVGAAPAALRGSAPTPAGSGARMHTRARSPMGWAAAPADRAFDRVAPPPDWARTSEADPYRDAVRAARARRRARFQPPVPHT